MTINTNNMISITEANQNFSRITRMVDENGSVIIMKNNTPKYLMIEFSQLEQAENMPDEDVMAISNRLMAKNREAYEVLAK
jgi:Phd_YefM.